MSDMRAVGRTNKIDAAQMTTATSIDTSHPLKRQKMSPRNLTSAAVFSVSSLMAVAASSQSLTGGVTSISTSTYGTGAGTGGRAQCGVEDPHDLKARFVDEQKLCFEGALAEIQAGAKKGEFV